MAMRVLIVDDERSIRVTLREFLREAGYDVEVASNGHEALELIRETAFDVVLADIIMPRMSGVKLLAAIHEEHPGIQTILMTGEPTVETAAEAVRGQAFDYLPKPISKRDVLTCIANASRLKASYDEQRRLEEENRRYRDTLEALVEQRTDDLFQSEKRFRNLFQEAPTPLWEEDFSQVKRFIEELRETGVDNFEEYFNAHPEQVVVAAGRVKILAVNRLVLSLHGVGSAQELGADLPKLFSQDSYGGFVQELLAVAEGRAECDFDSVVTDSEGRTKNVRVNWKVVPGHEESLERVYVSTPDITGRRLLEDSLRKSKSMLSKTGRMGRIGGWELDVERLEVQWTEETFRIHELDLDAPPPLEEAINFYHPDDRPTIEHAVKMAIEDGASYDLELRFITATGRDLWVHTIGEPEVSNGKTVRVSGTFQDITEKKLASLALIESEQRFRSLFVNAPVCIHEIDLDGKVLSMNPAGLDMAGGVSEEKLIGQVYLDLVSQPERPRIQALFDDAIDGTGSLFEFQATSALEEHSFWSSFIPIPAANGTVDRIMGVSDDITEKKRAEADSVRFGKVLENALNEIYIVDAETLRFRTVNRGARDNLGYSMDELRGMTPLDVNIGFTPESFSKLVDPVRGKSKSLLHIESTHLRKDGSTYPVEAHIQWISEGDPAFVAVIIDVSERRAQRQELNRLATVLDQAAVMVLITDLSGDIIYANPQATACTGYGLDELIGRNPRILSAQGGRNEAPEKLWNTITEGRTWTGTISNRKKDGTLYFDEATIFAIRGEDGQITNFASVQKDITERVLLSQERERLLDTIQEQARQEIRIQQRLGQQDRLAAVGQLAAGIAHDFNNIMGVISLYTTLLQQSPDLSAESAERLDTILEQSKHATGLTQQILDFGRRSAMELQPTDMTVFLKEVVELLGHTIPENISVGLETQGETYLASSDATRIQQVLMNLAVNARDAMPQGGRLKFGLDRLTTRPSSESPLPEMSPGDWIHISVEDIGEGIPKDKLPYIFEPFFTTKAPGVGTGLGLSQVYGILKQHNGHIRVDSSEGVGTTFHLYLPALRIAAAPEVLAESPAIHGQGEELLIVEDNATLRKALCETLEPLNYRVTEAEGGREALKILESRSDEISLIITDLVMPEMGGKELFLELKRRGNTIPVVVLTGHLMESELQTLRDQGLAGWMLKPPDPDRLSILVDSILTEASRSLLGDD